MIIVGLVVEVTFFYKVVYLYEYGVIHISDSWFLLPFTIPVHHPFFFKLKYTACSFFVAHDADTPSCKTVS